jgi:hypothetical protein
LSPEVAATVDRVRKAYGDHCFACGPSNPGGLHIEFLELGDDGTVTARFEARPEFRGALETLHGGIAATALDELLVWAGILGEGVMTVTPSISATGARWPSVVTSREAPGCWNGKGAGYGCRGH